MITYEKRFNQAVMIPDKGSIKTSSINQFNQNIHADQLASSSNYDYDEAPAILP